MDQQDKEVSFSGRICASLAFWRPNQSPCISILLRACLQRIAQETYGKSYEVRGSKNHVQLHCSSLRRA